MANTRRSGSTQKQRVRNSSSTSQATNERNNNTNNNAHNSNNDVNSNKKKPKKVKHNSTNRRQRYSQDRASTPEASNRSEKTFKNKTRTTLKLTLPESPNMINTLVNIIIAFLNELNSADDKAEILPWFGYDALKQNLKAGLRVPKDINGIRAYLNGCYIPTNPDRPEVTIWAKVYIGHNASYRDIEQAISNWCSNGGHKIFRNMVQAERVIEKGWFLWSTRSMDAGALVDEMHDEFEFEIGLRWKTIYTGKGKTREEDKIFALALELEATQAMSQAKLIANFYNDKTRAKEDYPNGIKLRFVKNIDDCVNRRDQAKILQLRSKQRSFLSAVKTTTSYDIDQIDYSGVIPEGQQDTGENLTLRQMIMSLKTEDDDSIPLFLSVDLDWKREGHTFQYAPDFTAQAERTIRTLLPILTHKFPTQNIEEFFTPEARERCRGMKVDETTGLVEEEGEDLYDIDADDDMLGFTFDFDNEATENLMRPRTTMPHDDDGVSTIRSGSSGNKRKRGTRSTSRVINLENESTNSGHSSGIRSTASSITAQTVRTIETQISAMQRDIQTTKDMFAEIQASLSALKPGGGPSPALSEIPEAGTEETQTGSGLIRSLRNNSRRGPSRRRFDLRRNVQHQSLGSGRVSERNRNQSNTPQNNSTNSNNNNLSQPPNPEGERENVINTQNNNTNNRRKRNRRNRRRKNNNNNNNTTQYTEPNQTEEDGREDIDKPEGEAHGDDHCHKQSDTLRIGTININSLPTFNEDRKNKNENIKHAIDDFQIDVLAIQEPNKNWYKIEEKHRWDQRTRTWWESRHNSIAFNTYEDSSEQFLPGGNIITSINKAAYRVDKAEPDTADLGRWTTTLFRGKNNIKTRVISAYRPCNVSSAGENTVYSQHERWLDDHKRNQTPRKAFLEDLGEWVNFWLEDGEQVILLMDANTDVRSNEIQQWAQSHGLREALTEDDHNIIATNSRGSVTIDGIFVSGSINVLRKGFSAFGVFPTDHRLLWIDILYINAFGHKMPPINIPGARRLKSDNVAVRNKWIASYEKHAKQYKLHEEIFSIEEEVNQLAEGEEASEELQRRFNKALIKRRRIIAIADRNCRKLRMNNNACCPEIDVIKKSITLYDGALTRKRGAAFSLDYIRRLEKRVHDYDVHRYSEKELIEKLNKAQKELFEKTKDADRIRTNFYKNKARLVAIEKDLNEATVYNQMIEREELRSAHRKIQYARGKLERRGTTMVEVYTPTGIEELTEKSKIEEACMEENDKKYHQTNDTPCMMEPLRSLLGKIGETEFSQSILDGTVIVPEGTDQYVTELFRELKFDDRVGEERFKPEITSSMFVEGWRKMKESTSAGISGLHFGHFKAATYSKYITEIESSIAHIPFRSGISPTSWQLGVDCMIHKKAKSQNVENMRTIVLQEADNNMNNKTLGREAIRLAEQFNLLAGEQYGSRPGRCSIDHALHKRIWYDIVRQSKRPAYMISNDAKSNYDRIIHSIAAIAYKRIGVPDPPVHSMLTTIQKMKHFIRTSYGDSVSFMDCSGVLIPYQGMLQGNGASPTTWVIVSTPLLNMLRSAGNGTHMTSSITKERSHIVAFAFVDDTDIPNAVLNGDEVTLEYIKQQAQDSVHRWEGGMKATGGAIRPDKSFVYAIDFEFDDNGDWTYRIIDSADADLEVKDHKNTMCPLESQPTNLGLETLGVYLAPNGSNTEHIKAMKDKTEKWAADIRAGHLNIKDSWLAINSTLISSIKYSLPSLTITREECTSIMKPALQVALNSLHISRNYPRNLVYGCRSEGGLGIMDIYHERGISQCYYIMKHLVAPTITGRFIRFSLEMAMIEMGIRSIPFNYNFKKFSPLLSDCWIKSVWEYAEEQNIEIDQYAIQDLPLLRENDSFISEDLVNSGLFRPKETRLFRNCAKFLQVLRVSEIFDGYGERFNETIFRGDRDSEVGTPYIWPRQARPSNDTFKTWRRILRKLYFTGGQQNCNLGAWYYGDEERPIKWLVQDTTPFNLYECVGNRTRVWKKNNSRGVHSRRPVYKYHTDSIHLPQNLRYATVKRINTAKLQVTGYASTTHRPNNINDIPLWGSDIILDDSTPPTPAIKQKLILAITSGHLDMVSDGSYFETHQVGSAAWFIDDGNEILLRGRCRTPGDFDVQNPYRSELFGLLCGVLHILKSLLDIEIQGSIRLCCDGKGALLAVKNKYGFIEPNRKHFDIISSIWSMMDTTDIKWTFQHIDSHQDDFTPFAELERTAQLNVLADTNAKEVCYEAMETGNIQPFYCALPFQKLQFAIDGQIVVSEFKKTLHTYISKRRARIYWKKKLAVSDRTFEDIDWELFNKSHNNYERPHFISKWTCGFCGVGIQLVRYGRQKFSNCPRCQEPQENVTHVLQCPHAETREIWNKELENLTEWLKDKNVDPELSLQIKKNLEAWHQSLDPGYTSTSRKITKILRAQKKLGWRRFIDGFWTKKWRKKQTDFMTQKKDRRSPLILLSKVQRKIWHIAWSLWDHRNKFLHEEGKRTHEQELEDQNELIIQEWLYGMGNLEQRYTRLFTGTLDERLEKSFLRNRQWLHSVWLARGRINDTFFQNSANTAVITFNRWLARNKPPESDDDEDE